MKELLRKTIIRWFVCILWEGKHDYHKISPMDIHYRYLAECKRCHKRKLF